MYMYIYLAVSDQPERLAWVAACVYSVDYCPFKHLAIAWLCVQLQVELFAQRPASVFCCVAPLLCKLYGENPRFDSLSMYNVQVVIYIYIHLHVVHEDSNDVYTCTTERVTAHAALFRLFRSHQYKCNVVYSSGTMCRLGTCTFSPAS